MQVSTDVLASIIVNAGPDLSLILGQHWTAQDSIPRMTTWTNKKSAVNK